MSKHKGIGKKLVTLPVCDMALLPYRYACIECDVIVMSNTASISKTELLKHGSVSIARSLK